MDRLIATNSVNYAGRDIAPVSGTPQYATDGVPGTTPATIWPAYAFNQVQDEIMAVIVAAGLTPDDTNWAQLFQAIARLAGGNVTAAITANTALTPDNAGFVPISAAAGNVTVTLPAAAAANGKPIPFHFVRTDTTINTVSFAFHAGDATELGGLSSAISLGPQARADFLGDGGTHWLVVGDFHGSQAFTSSGTFVVPPGVTAADVEVWGGGAGGYGSAANGPATGGSGGGYSRKRITGLTPGQSIAVTVGAAGAGGASGGNAGTAGGSSSFGAYLSATSGQPGTSTTSGGVGTGSGGDVNLSGAPGGGAITTSGSTYYGGGGGGAPQTAGSGLPVGSSGGANSPGGGGSGGGSTIGATAGANGAPGFVVVRW